MSKFEEQFPEYKLLPIKEPSKAKNALIWLGTIAALIGLPAFLIFKLSQAQIPTPNLAGVNKFTVSTMGSQAIAQSEAGDHQHAVISFQNYFSLGGSNPRAMLAYASSLDALGQTEQAL